MTDDPTNASHRPGPGGAPRASPEAAARPQRPLGERPVERLLECLAALTRIFGEPRTPASLSAGLPLVENRLTPELFVRAAQRVDIVALPVRRRLEEIPEPLLPAVLLLKNGSAALLLARKGDGRARLRLPGRDERELELEPEQLRALYSGHAILVRHRPPPPQAAEQPPRPPGSGWFWGTLAQFWPNYLQVMVAALMVNLFALASPLFVMNVYDRVVPNQALETLWVLAFGMLIVILFELVLQLLRGYLLDHAGKRADVLVSSKLFSQVVNVSLQASPVSTGAFANRLREFETLRDFVSSATAVTLVDLPFLVLFLVMIWMVGGPVALVPALAIPAVLAIGAFTQLPLKRAAEKGVEDNAQRHGILIETVTALDTVKALNLEGRMQRRWEQSIADAARTTLGSRLFSNLGVHLSKSFMRVVTVGVIVFGVYRISTGELSMGGLIACTILAGRAMEPLGQIAGLLTRLHHAMSALRGLNEIMALPVERPPEKRFLSRPAIRGEIEFRNVSFTFPGAAAPALRNLSFKVRAGERVGIIGPVGSGKTTIVKLLTGLYTPQEGTILVDGTDIRQIDPADLRRAVGFVQQDITLFQGTLRDNIAMALPEADDERVLRAARLSGVDGFIRRHPLGYDLKVGEKGRNLSGGQRQFVALARALLPDPPLFLLDEPTSMMDPQAEHHFIRHFDRASRRKTVLLITHKPALFPLVERLIVLREGQLLKDAPKAEVLHYADPRRQGGGRDGRGG